GRGVPGIGPSPVIPPFPGKEVLDAVALIRAYLLDGKRGRELTIDLAKGSQQNERRRQRIHRKRHQLVIVADGDELASQHRVPVVACVGQLLVDTDDERRCRTTETTGHAGGEYY